MLRLVGTIADASVQGQVLRIAGPLPVYAVLFAYEGTNGELTTEDFDSITGRMRVSIAEGDDSPVGNWASVEHCNLLVTAAEHWFGHPFVDSVAGEPFNIVLPLLADYTDRDYRGVPNVRWVGANQFLEIFVPAFDDTDCVGDVSCAVYLYLIPSVMRYNPVISEFTTELGGRQVIKLTSRGSIAGQVLSLEAGATDPDELAILRGDVRRVWGDWSNWPGVSHLFGRVEDPDGRTYPAHRVIDLTMQGRCLGAGLGKDFSLEIAGGDGDLNTLMIESDPHVGNAMIRSAAFARQWIAEQRFLARQVQVPGTLLPVIAPDPVAPVLPGKPEMIPPIIPPAEVAPVPVPRKRALVPRRKRSSRIRMFRP